MDDQMDGCMNKWLDVMDKMMRDEIELENVMKY